MEEEMGAGGHQLYLGDMEVGVDLKRMGKLQKDCRRVDYLDESKILRRQPHSV